MLNNDPGLGCVFWWWWWWFDEMFNDGAEGNGDDEDDDDGFDLMVVITLLMTFEKSSAEADGVNLDRIIPFRFYGDGCEAMRLLAKLHDDLLIQKKDLFGHASPIWYNHDSIS